jgi:two-component system, NarL family, nitrate/nitrite response regulator NarL
VLVADDHAPSRDDIQRALERNQRFSVCASVADAAGAIQAAVRGRPDVCLLDIRMPGDGLAATWEIAARLPQAKIVMLTVSDDDADLFAALRAGAHGYLLKSMSFQRLPDALDGVLSGEAPMPGVLVARVLEQFRGHEPRWRQPVGDGCLRQRLTSREWEILALLARQQSTGEIARRLMLSAVAVRVHIAAIVRKLGVPDRAAAVEVFRKDAET